MDIRLNDILDEKRIFYIVRIGRYFVATGREVAAAIMNVISMAKRMPTGLYCSDILRAFNQRHMALEYEEELVDRIFGGVTIASVEQSIARINGEEIEVLNIWFT